MTFSHQRDFIIVIKYYAAVAATGTRGRENKYPPAPGLEDFFQIFIQRLGKLRQIHCAHIFLFDIYRILNSARHIRRSWNEKKITSGHGESSSLDLLKSG